MWLVGCVDVLAWGVHKATNRQYRAHELPLEISYLTIPLPSLFGQLYQPLVVRRNPFFEEFLSYAAPAGNFMTALTVHFTKQFRPLLPEVFL